MQEQLLVNPAGIREHKFKTSKNVIGALISEPEAIHAGTIIFIDRTNLSNISYL